MTDCFPRFHTDEHAESRRHQHDTATAPPRARRGTSTGAEARTRRYSQPAQTALQRQESMSSCFGFTTAHLFGQVAKSDETNAGSVRKRLPDGQVGSTSAEGSASTGGCATEVLTAHPPGQSSGRSGRAGDVRMPSASPDAREIYVAAPPRHRPDGSPDAREVNVAAPPRRRPDGSPDARKIYVAAPPQGRPDVAIRGGVPNSARSDRGGYAPAGGDAGQVPLANPPPGREDVPVTGRPLAVRVKCSNRADGEVHIAKYLGVPVTSKWTVALLQEAIEAEAGVHRSCQTLMYKGRELEEDKSIESILASNRIAVNQIPDNIKFWVQVDEEPFPESLDSLCFSRVPLGHDDFELPKCGGGSRRLSIQFSEDGFYWQIPAKVLDSHGLNPPASAFWKRGRAVHGQASPIGKITLEQRGWEAACIPSAAKYIAWASPVADWMAVGEEPLLVHSSQPEEESRKQTAALSSFLRVGGFIYLGEDDHVVGVTTFCDPESGGSGGFHFERPRKWRPEWTQALVEHDRFQDVSTRSLESAGAKLYCWLRPGETFKSANGTPLTNQPQIPHGGFVYLFHPAPFEATESQLGLDRYFAVSASSGRNGATIEKPAPRYADPNEKKYLYEELKQGAKLPVGVDPASREQYLHNEEFRTVFGMEKYVFNKLPKWKVIEEKKSKQLF